MKYLTLLCLSIVCFGADIDVRFSPDGGCTKLIVQSIEKAKNTLHIQTYQLTSEPITDAIIEAAKRGVTVHIILDKSNVGNRNSRKDSLSLAGIQVKIDRQHSINHNKVIVIDSQVVITGSFNFSKNAERSNAENCIAIHDPQVALQFIENYNLHEKHSDDQ